MAYTRAKGFGVLFVGYGKPLLFSLIGMKGMNEICKRGLSSD